MEHFNRIPRRRAEFIKVPNMLKLKVGSGGLSEEILDKAQKLLEENTQDFAPLGELYLESLANGIEQAKIGSVQEHVEEVMAQMIYPAMQLKANGGMFLYPLITKLADRLIQFLEVIDELDIESIEIIMAYHSSMKAVLHGKISGDGGESARELLTALNQACGRYLDQRPPIVDFA